MLNFVIAAWFSLGLTAVTSVGQAKGPPLGTVVIDGRVNPELFPEWYVWEQAFLALARTNDVKETLTVGVGLSDAEAILLTAEVTQFQRRQTTLANQLAETKKSLIAQDKREVEIRDATQAVELRYRYDILEARQRLYDRLSADGILALRNWTDGRMRTTKVLLRGRAATYFRLPW